MILKLQIVSIEMKNGKIWISYGNNLFTCSNNNDKKINELLKVQAEYN